MKPTVIIEKLGHITLEKTITRGKTAQLIALVLVEMLKRLREIFSVELVAALKMGKVSNN